MLLFDLSGIVVHSCINLHHESREEVTLHAVRHVAFSTVLYYKKKYSKSHGTPVICVDCKPYWREAVFKYYKKNRKKSREDSAIDWEQFNENFNQVIEDIKEYSPYPVIDVNRAEGDDGICVLTQYAFARKQPVMIISSDKDMIQLQGMYGDVKQFSPARKKLLTIKDAEYDLLTHIIKGDRSDGIPNIFSPDDILVNPDGRRQKAVSKKMLEEVQPLSDPYDWDMINNDDEAKMKFKRNKLLIDAGMIPDRIKDSIVARYESELELKKRNRMRKFCIDNRMGALLESAQAF